MWYLSGSFWEDFRLGAGLTLVLAVLFYLSDVYAFAQSAGIYISEEFWGEYWSSFMTDGSRFFFLAWVPFNGLFFGVLGKFAIWWLGFDNWLAKVLLLFISAPVFLTLGVLTMFAGGWVAEGAWLLISSISGP